MRIFSQISTNEKRALVTWSLFIGLKVRKKSPLPLPFTLHLKTPTLEILITLHMIFMTADIRLGWRGCKVRAVDTPESEILDEG